MAAARRGTMPRPVLMIVHSYYDEDPRVRREAEAVVGSGRPVLVLGLRRPGEPADGELAGVRIRRLDVQRHQGASLWTYLAEYADFLLRAGWTAVRAHRRERFALAYRKTSDCDIQVSKSNPAICRHSAPAVALSHLLHRSRR